MERLPTHKGSKQPTAIFTSRHILPPYDGDDVDLQFCAHELDPKDFLGKSDSYFELQRLHMSNCSGCIWCGNKGYGGGNKGYGGGNKGPTGKGYGGGNKGPTGKGYGGDNKGSSWETVYRSPVIKSNLNPVWPLFTIKRSLLEAGEGKAAPIRITVWDDDSDQPVKSSSNLIGHVETTLPNLDDLGSKESSPADYMPVVHPPTKPKYTSEKKYKHSGLLQVLVCDLIMKRWAPPVISPPEPVPVISPLRCDNCEFVMEAKIAAEAARDRAKKDAEAANKAKAEAEAARDMAKDEAKAAKIAAETARDTAKKEVEAANKAKIAAETARDTAKKEVEAAIQALVEKLGVTLSGYGGNKGYGGDNKGPTDGGYKGPTDADNKGYGADNKGYGGDNKGYGGDNKGYGADNKGPTDGGYKGPTDGGYKGPTDGGNKGYGGDTKYGNLD